MSESDGVSSAREGATVPTDGVNVALLLAHLSTTLDEEGTFDASRIQRASESRLMEASGENIREWRLQIVSWLFEVSCMVGRGFWRDGAGSSA